MVLFPIDAKCERVWVLLGVVHAGFSNHPLNNPGEGEFRSFRQRVICAWVIPFWVIFNARPKHPICFARIRTNCCDNKKNPQRNRIDSSAISDIVSALAYLGYCDNDSFQTTFLVSGRTVSVRLPQLKRSENGCIPRQFGFALHFLIDRSPHLLFGDVSSGAKKGGNVHS